MTTNLQTAGEQRAIGQRPGSGGGTMVLLLCLLALGSGMTLAQGRELATAIEVTLRESTRGEQNGPPSRAVKSLGQTVSKIVRRVTEPSPALPSVATRFEPTDWPVERAIYSCEPVRVRARHIRVALLDLPPPVC